MGSQNSLKKNFHRLKCKDTILLFFQSKKNVPVARRLFVSTRKVDTTHDGAAGVDPARASAGQHPASCGAVDRVDSCILRQLYYSARRREDNREVPRAVDCPAGLAL